MKRFRDQKPLDTSVLPSLTEPNKSMKLSEVIYRHKNGMPVSASQRTPIYGSKGKTPEHFDLVEIQEKQMENEAKLEKLSQEAKAQIEENKNKKEQAKLEKLKEEWAKEQKTDSSANSILD